MGLGDLRKAIDAIDERLVALLNERAALAVEIGRWKRARNLPLYDPVREAEVLKRVGRQARRGAGPLDELAMARLFERIIDEARQLEITDASRGSHAGRSSDGGRDGRARVGGTVAARRRRAG
jgi:chorismate mutase